MQTRLKEKILSLCGVVVVLLTPVYLLAQQNPINLLRQKDPKLAREFELLLKKDPTLLDRLKEAAQPAQSYKTRIFNDNGYGIPQLQTWLTDYIANLPQEQRPIFEQARFNLAAPFEPRTRAPISSLTTQQTYLAWERLLQRNKAVSLQEKNPFTLPELRSARLILLGEDHTHHYPAEQMVEQIISYNKTAPQGEKITHLFVEFSYQGNFAMDYLRAHRNDGLDEPTLFKQAITYSKEKMGSHYIPATLREQVRWLRLGYRLLQENTEVQFYAYDRPSSSVLARNQTAWAFMDAVYKQPHTKAVFIGGALHMLRGNIPTALFRMISAAESLPNIPTVPDKDIVTIFIAGGQQWTDDLPLYGGQQEEKELYDILLEYYQDKPGTWALKTNPATFGFDYYFIFDQHGVPTVTDANRW